MRPVPKMPDRLALEARVQAWWRGEGIFDALRAQVRDGDPFSFLDGPITANNPMAVHHAWGRTIKDVVQRYHAMNGRNLRWQNGFDCQGLWVEVEVEKALGFDSKRDIEAFGLDRFAAACRERVVSFAARISEQSARLGMWMDWDRSYFTMTDTNISCIWGFLAECHRRGWLYRGHQLMPWCHRCGTSLSQHELADSYTDLNHPSVFLALALEDGGRGGGECVAVWTTTPWTLPANVALAVAPHERYVLARTGHGDVWIAQARLAEVMPGPPRVLATAVGRDLVGRTYAPPVQRMPGVPYRIVGWEGVAVDEGTGVVHIAPGCGAEDFALARTEDLPVLAPIDEDGRYVEGYGPLTGRHVTEVTEEILAALSTDGRLLRAGEIVHRYPRCWRCSTPLVHRAVDEWFIRCDEIREPMRRAAASVEWHPPHMGKRMDDWLANMGDWCISRKRYWGLPLPFYLCADGHLTVLASKDDLPTPVPELHRPWIDEVTVSCHECGETATRVPEVGDCWLDAGIVPFSTIEDRDRWFPAELVCEMHEQIRLWFYSLLFLSVVLDGRAPYRRVLTHGRVNDEHGAEMHKSWGNAISFDDAVGELGADTMRWLFAAQPPSRDLNFGAGPAREVARRFLTFWNSYAFFATYAALDGFEPDPAIRHTGPGAEGLTPLDRWLLGRVQQLVGQCRTAIEALDLPAPTVAFESFADDLSNWYVRLSRHRFWTGHTDRAAHETLWYALVTAVRCIAPVMPFVADEIWGNLTGGEAERSVHLSGYPVAQDRLLDQALLEAMADTRLVTDLGRAARTEAGVRRRQPLPALLVAHHDPSRRNRLVSELVARECNVKDLRVVADAGEFGTLEVVPDFGRLGPRLRGDLPRVAELLRSGRFTASERGYVVDGHILDPADVALRTRAKPGFAVAEADGWVVALDTEITPELQLEGRARDLVREVQERRKALDLEVTDRIDVTYGPEQTDAVAAFDAWIREQTLADSLTPGGALRVTPASYA